MRGRLYGNLSKGKVFCMRVNPAGILFARSGLVGALTALVCALGTISAQEPPKTLVITEVLPIPVDGPMHEGQGGSLYYRVEASYPQEWQDAVENTFAVKVDGQPATYQATGAGFGGGAADEDFWVYLGGPGKKKVEVTLVKDGKVIGATKEFTVAPVAVLRVLGHYDNECLLDNDALKLIAFGVQETAVKVNGQPVETSAQNVKGFHGISLVMIPPSLRAGENTVEYAGSDAEGKRVSGSLALYYAAGNKMKAGDRCLFPYGKIASKSGPFYYVGADGEALANTGGVKWETVLEQDEKGWIGAIEALGNPIQAKKPGKGVLTLSVKHNFLQPEELDKKVEITVEP